MSSRLSTCWPNSRDRTNRTVAPKWDVVRTTSEWSWEGLRHLAHFRSPAAVQAAQATESDWAMGAEPSANPKRAKELLAFDRLRHREHVLRLGWFWFAGTPQQGELEGKVVCLPVLSAAIELVPRLGGAPVVELNGDPAVNPGIDDSRVRFELLNSPEFGAAGGYGAWSLDLMKRMPRLLAWGQRAAKALGLEIQEWLPPGVDPLTRRRQPGVAAIPGTGLYTSGASIQLSRADLLASWRGVDDIASTAFARIYCPETRNDEIRPRPRLSQTRPLDRSQISVVEATVAKPVVAVLGPPGTGKTHTLCEIALESIAAGGSVLIGANSEAAVRVLDRHLRHAGGPVPVRFGGGRSSAELSTHLTEVAASARLAGSREASGAAQRLQRDVAERRTLLMQLVSAETEAVRLKLDPAYRLLQEDRLGCYEPLLPEARSLLRRRGLLAAWGRRRLRGRLGADGADLCEVVALIEGYVQARRPRSARLPTSACRWANCGASRTNGCTRMQRWSGQQHWSVSAVARQGDGPSGRCRQQSERGGTRVGNFSMS